MTRPPAELHAAAVEGADEAVQKLLVSSKHFPRKGDLAGAAIRAYLAVLAEAGWKVVPKRISDDHMMRAVNSVEDGVIDGWSWDILHDAAPPWPPLTKDST